MTLRQGVAGKTATTLAEGRPVDMSTELWWWEATVTTCGVIVGDERRATTHASSISRPTSVYSANGRRGCPTRVGEAGRCHKCDRG
ncbi:uncharacterized protein B0I36DRAFT_317536 [Microdochium trichocladiopsis]|uniref:Uncharacterized protein n=1 Tax=Microdochium trichocladiopsis TaxID=1682393 RepID=A0A9P9BSQ4_9PEZI|nr:uncharacterized protein B0I36DRAFT_317536 [Microdochium trichocladiopsis]KAH7035070.1 hypothetical protein B0I36DRAFT_317536 [Microdochium trichocladiopsis]